MTNTSFSDKLYLNKNQRRYIVEKRILTEQSFQTILIGRRLTPDEEDVLRKKFGLAYDEKINGKSANERKRLLMKAHLKVMKK